jgi:hypothetical protein
MPGHLLGDLDSATWIHVLGDAGRPEAVTTNPFDDPARTRAFLNQLQDTRTVLFPALFLEPQPALAGAFVIVGNR